MTASASPIKFNRFQDMLEGKEGQILLAAFQCIVEKGLSASSTHAIAAQANLNQGSIHYYFKSKYHLITRLIEALLQNSTNNIHLVRNSGLSPQEKIRQLIAAGESFIGLRRDEFVVFVAIWAYAISNGGTIRDKYQAMFIEFRESIMATLRDAGMGPDQCEQVALLIVGAIEGLGLQIVMDPDAFDLSKTIRFIQRTLTNLM